MELQRPLEVNGLIQREKKKASKNLNKSKTNKSESSLDYIKIWLNIPKAGIKKIDTRLEKAERTQEMRNLNRMGENMI